MSKQTWLVSCKLFYIISQASHWFFTWLMRQLVVQEHIEFISCTEKTCKRSKAHIQYKMNSKYSWNEKHWVLLLSHVRKLSATHLRNVSKLSRSSLVKLYIDYLLLKQFQRAEVLSAQMWVQLQSGAQSKINIVPIRFFSGGSSREKI